VRVCMVQEKVKVWSDDRGDSIKMLCALADLTPLVTVCSNRGHHYSHHNEGGTVNCLSSSNWDCPIRVQFRTHSRLASSDSIS
jgi:hypothetical protein